MPEGSFISRVVLRNYKSIQQCDVRLGQITFLVGLNGAGKSNFVEALRFLSIAIGTSLDAALTSGSGFGNIIRRGSVLDPVIGFEIGLQLGANISCEYKVEIKAASSGPVLAEECTVENCGSKHWFTVAGGRVQSDIVPTPAASEGKLYLVNASGIAPFEPVYRALSNIEVYNPVPDEIRPVKLEMGVRHLDRAGNALAEVVRQMRNSSPERWERVSEYLMRINPALTRVDVVIHSGIFYLVFVQNGLEFTSLNMSDGTLRALAVLVALFQNNPLHPLSLIGLEEPEASLHPAAAGVLFDALMEGSQFRQVIVTSHSPDLLDRDDIPPDSLKAVVMENGQTYIGEVDAFGKRAMKEHLYTAGELLRMDQLRPERIPELADIA